MIGPYAQCRRYVVARESAEFIKATGVLCGIGDKGDDLNEDDDGEGQQVRAGTRPIAWACTGACLVAFLSKRYSPQGPVH